MTATTDSNGEYTLQFNGTYGNKSAGSNNGAYPNYGLVNDKSLVGKVADSPQAGTWYRAAADSKHINLDYVYVQPILDESANVNPDNFRTAMFTNPAWNISYATRAGNDLNAAINSDFALKPSKPGFDVVDYNTTDKPAFKGTTVQTKTVGLVPNTPYTIQWYNAAGEKVGTTCKATSDDLGAVPSCPFTVPDTAKAGDVFTAVVELPDGTPFLADSFIVQEPITDSMDPKYEDKLVVPGKETKSSPTFTDKDGKKVDAPEGSKFAIDEDFKVPEGYVVEIDPDTGEIIVTFPDKSKLNKDTKEAFDVPVTVTYPDGSKDDAKANFKLDTDGDGDPDVTDPDDDNDGIPDEDDSNPKVPNANENLEPGYKDGSGKPGSDVKIDAPEFKDENGEGKVVDAPEGTKFTPGENVPDGVTIDENTGEITVTIPEDAKPGDKITVPVEVTYPDGSKDNVDVTVTVEEPDAKDKDADTYEPGYEDGSGKPGEDVKVEKPEFKDKDGNDTKAPEGTKFTPGENAPDGVTIDENTGEITVPIPEGANPGDKITVPVEVTYPDGSKDNVDVTVTVEEPDAKDKDADTYEPGYEDGSGKPGDEVKIDEPTFKDKDGNDTKAPEDTKFTPGENAPDGVTIDENTGEITVPIPEGANPGDKITVPVEVTYPDGSKDNVDVIVTVEEPDAEKPDWKDDKGKPGDKVEIPNEGGPVPDGSTVETEGPGKAEIDEDGNLIVDIDKDAKPGDTIEIVVKDKDGNEIDTVIVTVEEDPDAPKQADELEPKYNDGAGQPGTTAPVDAPTFTNKEGETVTVPEGTKFATDEDGVEVAEDGSLKVQIPADAKPGDKITVTVTVTYPDGSTDQVDATVTVTDADSKPEWGDGEGEPGDKVTVPNEGGDVPEGSTVETEGPGKVEIDENGNLVVDIDEDANPGDKIVIVVKDEDGNKIGDSTVTVTEPSKPDTKQNEEFEPGYEDGSGKPGEDVTVPAPEFKDKDGKDTKAPEGTKFTPGEDAPDGVTIDENTGEITVPIPEGANPGDKITVPVEVTYPDGSKDNVDVIVTVEEPDAEKPDWKDDKGKPGDKVEIPNEGGPVPDGSTVETEGPGKAEIDEDGNLIVDIDKDAKPGDKIEVVVKDKDGNEIDRVVVEVEKPADQPDWKDDKGKPGDKIVIPNEGGPVPDGSTVETEGPGKAEIDKDGNIVVDINDDAKPGDKIVVTVKDKDGNVIDTITVTVEEDGNAGSGGDKGKPAPAPGKPGDSGDKGSSNAPLPRTGVEIAGALAAAAGLLAAGVLMVARSRRKNN